MIGIEINMTKILYRHYDENDRLLYIGVSNSFFERLSNHKNHSHWFEKVTKIHLEHFDSQEDLLIAEKKAIKKEKPLHNIRYSDVNKIPTNPILNTVKVCRLLGVNRWTFNRMIEDGRFPVEPIKGTKPKLWNSSFVNAWIEENKNQCN